MFLHIPEWYEAYLKTEIVEDCQWWESSPFAKQLKPKRFICTMEIAVYFLFGQHKCILCWFLRGNRWNGWNELNPFGCKHRCKVGMLQDEFATCWNATAISQQEQLGNCCKYHPLQKKVKESKSLDLIQLLTTR